MVQAVEHKTYFYIYISYRNLCIAEVDFCSNRTLTALYLCLLWHPIVGTEISEFMHREFTNLQEKVFVAVLVCSY